MKAIRSCGDFEQIERKSAGAHLVVAVAAARAGLLNDADKELRVLAKENPHARLPNEPLRQLEDALTPRR